MTPLQTFALLAVLICGSGIIISQVVRIRLAIRKNTNQK
jgi:hypothetical protein